MLRQRPMPIVSANILKVNSVEFVQTGNTGDLSNDNPTGQGGTPAVQGGYRFFPDAATLSTSNKSRNIILVRAILNAPLKDVPIYFRAFDVDDPSNDRTIDPNGGEGRDNHGTVIGANVDTPGPSVEPGSGGFLGRLRPAGSTTFAAEDAIVTVNSRIANGRAIAEVELAISFAPGDNFRVVASCNRSEVANLNSATGVPTSGAIPNFTGSASP